MNPIIILNSDSNKNVLITCEHASTEIPKKYGTFGLDEEKIKTVSDYVDRGAKSLASSLSQKMDTVCIMPSYSRLLINVNKPIDHPKIVNDNCFGTIIPGNQNLSIEELKSRIQKYYVPFHDKIRSIVMQLRGKNKRIFFISVHTFYDILNGVERNLDIGILFKYPKDEKFCNKVKDLIEKKSNHVVKFNEPYSAHETAGYTMNENGKDDDITCIEFEVNDKHLRDEESVERMGILLSEILLDAMNIQKTS